MEKRIGSVAILLTDRESVKPLNTILYEHCDIIQGRLGIPQKDKNIHIISLIVEGSTDEISAMTGKIGRLRDVQVKSVLTKYEP